VGESYVRRRNRELGIPPHLNGEPDYAGDGKWHTFDPRGRKGGTNTTGVVIDSGVLNPELLRGKKGGRIWRRMRLIEFSGLSHTAFELAVYASQGGSPHHHARLASGCCPGFARRDWVPERDR
jgi:hypothetical protein